MRLPPRGRIGIFFGSWYSEPLVARAFGRLSRARYDRVLSDIAFFEQMLAEDGALVVKLWIHLSEKGLRRRLRRLEGDPATSWKVTPRRLEALPEVRPLHRGLRARDPAHRHEPRAVGPRRGDRRALPRPDGRAHAPRALPSPARVRRAAPRRGRAEGKPGAAAGAHEAGFAHDPRPRRPDEAALRRRLREAPREGAGPSRPARARRFREEALVGGRLRGLGRGGQGRRHPPPHRRRWTRARTASSRSPPRPTRRTPTTTCGASGGTSPAPATSPSTTGRGTGACSSSASRASRAPTSGAAPTSRSTTSRSSSSTHGIVLAKFWLHVDAKEQLRRFEERENDRVQAAQDHREDWRNREKWDAYEEAVDDMVARTSTDAGAVDARRRERQAARPRAGARDVRPSARPRLVGRPDDGLGESRSLKSVAGRVGAQEPRPSAADAPDAPSIDLHRQLGAH